MNERYYRVLCEGLVIAEHMTLELALLLIQAMFAERSRKAITDSQSAMRCLENGEGNGTAIATNAQSGSFRCCLRQ